jgi:hypothetical protein
MTGVVNMAETSSTLTERQVMMLSHLLTKVLRDPNKVVAALKDARASLQELGATESDVDAITGYLKELESALKDDNNVGWW